MHPDLIGALARQHMREFSRQGELWRSSPANVGEQEPRRGLLRRVRWHVGAALLDMGLHLMVAT